MIIIFYLAHLAIGTIVGGSLATISVRLWDCHVPHRPMFTVTYTEGHPDSWDDDLYERWSAGPGYLGTVTSFSIRVVLIIAIGILIWSFA